MRAFGDEYKTFGIISPLYHSAERVRHTLLKKLGAASRRFCFRV